MTNKPKFDFAVGGQAVIEGVMMRSKHYIAIAVRKKDKSIKMHDFKFTSLVTRYKFLNLPLIRGVLSMLEMMVVGFKALNFSSDEFELDDEPTNNQQPKKPNKFLTTLFIVGNIVVSLALALLLFKFLPLFLTELFYSNDSKNHLVYNLIDGILKLAIFTLYIYLISLSTTIKRVFQYHGAEHKAVFNYEHAPNELTVPNSQRESRFHPRCGTSFVIFVFLISIFVYSFLPRDPSFMLNFLKRILVLPIIAGLSYELLKYSANHLNSKFVKFFTKPGLLFQSLTTAEPTDDQVEVALAALKRTLDLELEASTASTHTHSPSATLDPASDNPNS